MSPNCQEKQHILGKVVIFFFSEFLRWKTHRGVRDFAEALCFPDF